MKTLQWCNARAKRRCFSTTGRALERARARVLRGDFLVIDATPPFVFLGSSAIPFLASRSRRAKGGHARVGAPIPRLLLYVSSGAALFEASTCTQNGAERNQVRGWGLARLTREIEIIEQSRRPDDICSRPRGQLASNRFIDCRDCVATSCFRVAARNFVANLTAGSDIGWLTSFSSELFRDLVFRSELVLWTTYRWLDYFFSVFLFFFIYIYRIHFFWFN